MLPRLGFGVPDSALSYVRIGTPDSAFLETFDRLVAKHGLDKTLDVLRRSYLHRHAQASVGGRRVIDDTERLVRMAHHLAGDADLRERRLAQQSDQHTLSEAARRAIRDLPYQGDTVLGDIHPKAVRRLVTKFKKWPSFFAFDDTAEHGLDQGVFLT
jgi:hypothetical protein